MHGFQLKQGSPSYRPQKQGQPAKLFPGLFPGFALDTPLLRGVLDGLVTMGDLLFSKACPVSGMSHFLGADMENPELVTSGKFTRRLGISRWTFRHWLKAGILPAPCIQAGRITRWTAAAVNQFLTKGVA